MVSDIGNLRISQPKITSNMRLLTCYQASESLSNDRALDSQGFYQKRSRIPSRACFIFSFTLSGLTILMRLAH